MEKRLISPVSGLDSLLSYILVCVLDLTSYASNLLHSLCLGFLIHKMGAKGNYYYLIKQL